MKIGTYAVEKDYSHYVAYAAKTIFAVVGTATKGPVGVATVCTSAQDLVNKFGPLDPKCYGLYASQYFLSQSTKLYFVRAASKSAAAASAKIAGMNSSDTEVEDAVTVQYVTVGTYADGYSVVVAEGTEGGKYNLLVRNKSGATLETVSNISLDELTTSYKTKYIQVSAVNTSAASLTLGTYPLSGGNDGIEGIEAADYINAANSLYADTVDMNLFAVPGVSDASVITAMLALAETRGDCMYLVDPPQGLTREGVVNWCNGGGDYEHTAFNSSYGAVYYDWITIYDSVNRVRLNVPPSVVVSASIAYSDRTTEVWYAPAGLQRGIVRGVLESVTKLSKSDTEYLYEHNINSLYDDPQVGLVLWGQKTLLQDDTSLNRVNVRRLLNYLKRVITAACNYLTFEPNDRVSWNSFEMKILPVLKNIEAKRGIYNYRVIKGETIITNDDIDNYRMPCMVMIRPTKAAEEIPIYFTITSTGADFNEVLDAYTIISE